MTCFNPKPVSTYWTTTIDKKTGEIRPTKGLNFSPKWDQEWTQIPCGVCEGCRIRKSQDTATRAFLEATEHQNNCFVTFTYDNEHLPKPKSLNKRDMQLFWKKLRKHLKNQKIKYIMCGEYGPTTRRPHYHAIIFNYWPNDAKFYKFNENKDLLFTSKELTDLWGNGFVIFGLATYQSAAYVARYVYKKAYGGEKIALKLHQTPEYTRCSTRPAIAKDFIFNEEKFKIIKRNNGVLIPTKNGIKIMPIPLYFRNWWRSLNWEEYFKWTEQQQENFKNLQQQTLKKTDKNAWEYKKSNDEEKKKSLQRLDKYRNNNINLS